MDNKKRQKALDDEMRSRLDKLGIGNTVMTLEDAKRLPKFVKYEIRWGKQQTVLSKIKFFILVMFYKTRRLIRN